MQQYLLKQGIKLLNVVILMLSGIIVQAQDKIQIDKEEIGSWFERHWIWVAGGLVLILIIALLSRGNSKAGSRKTTTVVKDAQGLTKSVTTTEEKF
jgi:cell division protein FtsW (lipid II flippase)